MELSKTARALLETIVNAGGNGTYVDAKKLSVLEKAELVEVKHDRKNDKGHVAVRATAAGRDAVTAPVNQQPATEPETTTEPQPKEQSTMTISKIADNVAVPPTAHGARASKYPINDLEVGQSFFVLAEGDALDATAKQMNGVTHNANRRHSEPTGNMTTIKRGKRAGEEVPERRQTRLFASRRIKDGAEWGYPGQTGVAVWRLPLDE